MPVARPEHAPLPPDALACRDRAMLALFHTHPLRLCTLAALDLAALDLSNARLRLPERHGRPHELQLTTETCTALQDWLTLRQAFAVEPALFVGAQGRRLTPRAVQQRVRQLALHLQRQRPDSIEPLDEPPEESEPSLRADTGAPQDGGRLDFRYLAQVYARAHPRAQRTASPADDDGEA